jgi:histidine triad (HIT) family protein
MSQDCLFCNIAAGKTDTAFLFENDRVVVFKDINPHAPVHLLIVPKRHIRSINDLTDGDRDIVSELIVVARNMAEQQGIAASGYKLLFNVEKGGGQVIFHLHLHLLGGWQRKTPK